MAAGIDELKSLRIWFTRPDDEEKGFYALLTSGMPVQATQDGRYITNQKQCDMLTRMKIHYEKEPIGITR